MPGGVTDDLDDSVTYQIELLGFGDIDLAEAAYALADAFDPVVRSDPDEGGRPGVSPVL